MTFLLVLFAAFLFVFFAQRWHCLLQMTFLLVLFASFVLFATEITLFATDMTFLLVLFAAFPFVFFAKAMTLSATDMTFLLVLFATFLCLVACDICCLVLCKWSSPLQCCAACRHASIGCFQCGIVYESSVVSVSCRESVRCLSMRGWWSPLHCWTTTCHWWWVLCSSSVITFIAAHYKGNSLSWVVVIVVVVVVVVHCGA